MEEKEFLNLCKGELGGTRYPMTQELNMAELVVRIQASAQRIAQAMLKSRLGEDPRREPAEPVCRKCGWKLRIQNSAQRRIIETALGQIEYDRAYGVCDRCGHSGAPLDEALGIPIFGPSVEARQKICHASVIGRSFEDGQEILKVHTQIELSAKHVRTIAEKEGRNLVYEHNKEVDRYKAGEIKFEALPSADLLVVTADGGRVQMREAQDGERWKEDKIGVVYDAIPQAQPGAKLEEYEGAKAQTKTYVATMDNWESMGWSLRLESERRGYGQAKTKIFVADGAKAIRELKNLQFPEAIFILDWPHAVQHLSDSAKAFFGEGSPEAGHWYENHKSMLWEGKVDTLIQDLQRLSKRAGFPKDSDPENSPRRILYQNAFSYYPNNKDALDYPYFCKQGWPIGSGVAEGAIKQFALRLKGSEKFWNHSQTGAEEMLALCALYHSEDARWDKHWQRRAQPR
jgi:hypothetical protein